MPDPGTHQNISSQPSEARPEVKTLDETFGAKVLAYEAPTLFKKHVECFCSDLEYFEGLDPQVSEIREFLLQYQVSTPEAFERLEALRNDLARRVRSFDGTPLSAERLAVQLLGDALEFVSLASQPQYGAAALHKARENFVDAFHDGVRIAEFQDVSSAVVTAFPVRTHEVEGKRFRLGGTRIYRLDTNRHSWDPSHPQYRGRGRRVVTG